MGYNKKPVIIIKKNCSQCKIDFLSTKFLKKKFCTAQCYFNNKKGKKLSEIHKRKISQSLKGKPKSEEHRLKVIKTLLSMSIKERNLPVGKDHFNWKGDKVGYSAIHDWVEKYKIKSEFCAKCHKKDIGTPFTFQWSNKSGLYKRDLKDWTRLCIKCHRGSDKNKKIASLLFNTKIQSTGKKIYTTRATSSEGMT